MNWMLPRITDHWDVRTGAVFTLGKQLDRIEREDRTPTLLDIVDAVATHCDALGDDDLVRATWLMTDDLYRSAATMSCWSDGVHDYLRSSAWVLLTTASARGYTVRYVVDNAFERTPVGLAGPARYFGLVFRAAGFVYICPQEIARHKMQADERRADSWTDLLPAYLPDARRTAGDVLRGSRAVGSHSCYLDAESSEHAFAIADPDVERPGTILLLRSEEPAIPRVIVRTTPPAAI